MQEDPQQPQPAEQRDSLDTQLAPLPTVQQRVIRLLYLHDLSRAQAAAVLGLTPDHVRHLHKRARDMLREIVVLQSNG
jgi:RNA polymerase sigma factor (sigma-70 family)